MQIRTCMLYCVVVACLGFVARSASATSTQADDLTTLRNEIEATKLDYEKRLQALEERAQAAEKRSRESDPSTTEATTSSSAYTRFAQAFNPKISAILQGRLAYLQGEKGDRNIPGFLVGDETGRGPEGLALGESELVFSANVDDRFYGFFNVSFDQEEIGIEEAYLSTLSLPFGLAVKAGQFFSAIGDHNARHSHTWDFIDSPLVYDVMLDGALLDPGVQISWIAPTDIYIEFGGEVLRGDAFPAEGATNHGFGSATVFAKISNDLGDSHSWKTGVSYLRADANDRDSDAGNGSAISFDGTTDLIIAEFTWKWAPLGNFRERNFTFHAEYMYRHEDGTLRSNGAVGKYHGDQNGFYAQGVYQFMPRWRVGLRYGQLFSDNRVRGLPPTTVLDRDFSSPRRISAMLDFSNSEFSRLRLQYSHESGGLGDDSLIFLQYIISIGSHGAHAF